MSKFTTIARPYAKAAFNFAIECQKIDQWQDMLSFAAEVSKNKKIKRLFSGILAREKLSEIFIAICGEKLDQNGQNFIRVMAKNNRLNILQNVLDIFIKLRETRESITRLELISASKLNEKQISKIKTIMEKYLSSKIKLDCKTDKSLIAGIIICFNNIIIDGSIRSRLERLANVLHS